MNRKLAAWASALPDIGLAAMFLVVWIDPLRLGPHWISKLMLVMLVEFVLVHATAFLGQVALAPGAMWKRSLGVLGFSAFYMIFIGAFMMAFDAIWPLYAFLGLMASHLGVIWLGAGNASDAQKRASQSWVMGAASYLFAVLVTTFLPMPSFGIGPEVVQAAALKGSGLWIDQPWRVIGAGALYFCINAWFKSQSWRW